MTWLILAAIIWIGAHVGIAGTAVRGRLAARLGDGGFRAAYSVVSVAALVFLIQAWQRAAPDTVALWVAPVWLRWVLVAVMLVAFLLFVASVARPNPTAAGGERALAGEARGMQRITRHPMLWSFALWSAVHVIGNGDLASLLFFGAFGVTALVGMPSIDAKLARRDPADWSRFAAATSILPFGAIAAGRNRLAWREIGWVVPAIALVVWASVFHFHPWLFGVAPVPMGG